MASNKDNFFNKKILLAILALGSAIILGLFFNFNFSRKISLEKDPLARIIPATVDFYATVNLTSLTTADTEFRQQLFKEVNQKIFPQLPINFINTIASFSSDQWGLFKVVDSSAVFWVISATNKEALAGEIKRVALKSDRWREIPPNFYVFSSELSDFSLILPEGKNSSDLFINNQAGKKYQSRWQKSVFLNGFFRKEFIQEKVESLALTTFLTSEEEQKSFILEDFYIKLAKKEEVWQLLISGWPELKEKREENISAPISRNTLFLLNRINWANLRYLISNLDLLSAGNKPVPPISNYQIMNHLLSLIVTNQTETSPGASLVSFSLKLANKDFGNIYYPGENNKYNLVLIIRGVNLEQLERFEADVRQVLTPLSIIKQEKILPDGTKFFEQIIDHNQVIFREKVGSKGNYRYLENNNLNIHLAYATVEDKLILSLNIPDLLEIIANKSAENSVKYPDSCQLSGEPISFVNIYYLLLESLSLPLPTVLDYYQSYFPDYKNLVLGKNIFNELNVCIWE